MMRTLWVSCLCCTASALTAGGPVTPFATATPGTGGIAPKAWVEGEPRLSNAGFRVTLEHGAGGAMAALLLSAGTAATPIAGATLWVDPASALVVGPITLGGSAGGAGTGSGAVGVPIPSAPTLEGMTFFCQWLVLDGGAGGGLAASDALRTTIRREAAFVSVLPDALETVTAIGTFRAVFGSGSTPWLGGNIELSRDGRTALVRLLSFGSTYTGLFDVAAQPSALLQQIPTPFNGAAFHPTVDRCYTAETGAGLSYYDVDRTSPTFGQRLGGVPQSSSFPTFAVSVSADGRRLAARVPFGNFLVVDVDPASPSRDQILRSIQTSAVYTGPDAINGDGSAVLTCDGNGQLVELDLTTGQVRRSVQFGQRVRDLAVDARGRFAAVALGTAQIALVDLESNPNALSVVTIPTSGPVFSLALPADGATIVVRIDSRYEVIDRASGVSFATVPSPAGSGAFDFAVR